MATLTPTEALAAYEDAWVEATNVAAEIRSLIPERVLRFSNHIQSQPTAIQALWQHLRADYLPGVGPAAVPAWKSQPVARWTKEAAQTRRWTREARRLIVAAKAEDREPRRAQNIHFAIASAIAQDEQT